MNPDFTSNKLPHYLLDYDNFSGRRRFRLEGVYLSNKASTVTLGQIDPLYVTSLKWKDKRGTRKKERKSERK